MKKKRMKMEDEKNEGTYEERRRKMGRKRAREEGGERGGRWVWEVGEDDGRQEGRGDEGAE